MHITILGRGPLAEPLAQLAERAGHTVRRVQEAARPSDSESPPDLVILAGSTTAVEPMLESLSSSMPDDVVVVDASIPTEREQDAGKTQQVASEAGWITKALPRARVVRAFASVPVEALSAVLERSKSDQSERLAVPIAGDDRPAKTVVGKFIHEIGAEPFDLGALTNAVVLDPGGPLWGKALNEVEMMETVGWLSGDG